ncbi:unnamed protein product [Malus baccata var. baccata]
MVAGGRFSSVRKEIMMGRVLNSLNLELDGSEDLRDSKVFAEFSLRILVAGSVPRIKVLVGLVSFHWTLSNMQANVTVLGAAKALQSACLQFQCC